MKINISISFNLINYLGNIVTVPTIHPSSPFKVATSNRYVISSSSSRLEKLRGSHVSPPVETGMLSYKWFIFHTFKQEKKCD